jgi:hypothetical protein
MSLQSKFVPLNINLDYGLNVDSPKSEIGLRESINIDFPDGGGIEKRKGTQTLNDLNYYVPVSISGLGITSIYQFAKKSGSGSFSFINLLTYDGKISKTDSVETNSLAFDGVTELDDGYGNDYAPKWETMNNRAFAVTLGYNLWTDGTNVYTNVLSSPSVPTGNEAASGSLVPGVYRIAYSYVRTGDFGYETNRSPYLEVTVTTTSYKIEMDVTAGDTQFDKINTYMSEVGGTVLYYVSQVSNTTATVDLTDVTASSLVAPESNDALPKAKFITVAGNRMFLLHIDDSAGGSSRIVWSNIDNPHFYDSESNIASFDRDDGQEIKGGAVVQNSLIVFKDSKIFTFDVFGLFQNLISSSKGLLSSNSIQSIGDGRGVIFLSNNFEVMLYGGGGPDRVVSLTTKRISKYIEEKIDADRLDEVISAYDQYRERYHIKIPVKGGRYMWLVRFNSGAWGEYIKNEPTSFSVMKDSDSTPYLISSVRRQAVGELVKHDYTSTDDGLNIVMNFKTMTVGWNNFSVRKTIRRLHWRMRSYNSEIIQREDESLWGYLFSSEINDQYETNPFGSGIADASSYTGSNVPANAFDGNPATSWESADGSDTGLRLELLFNSNTFLYGDFGGYIFPMVFYEDYSGNEWVSWDWGSESYSIYALRIIPVAGNVKDFTFQAMVDGGSEWVDLLDGTCGVDGGDYVYRFSQGTTPYRHVRLLVTSTHSVSTAKITELDLIVYDSVQMQGYIFNRNQRPNVRKCLFRNYSSMKSFIDTWKANNSNWTVNYFSDITEFDINSIPSIGEALDFTDEAALNDSNFTWVEEDKLLNINIDNDIFMTYESGSINGEVIVYKNGYTDATITKSVESAGVNNYLVDNFSLDGDEAIRTNVYGKGYGFSIKFTESGNDTVAIDKLVAYCVPSSELVLSEPGE